MSDHAPRDPLDGYRGNPIATARKIVQATDKPDAQVWDRIYVGGAALNLMQGIATIPEIQLVIATVIAQCDMDVQESTRQFLAQPDPSSEEARKHHFNARVSVGIINRLNQMVRDAAQLGAMVNDPDRGNRDE